MVIFPVITYLIIFAKIIVPALMLKYPFFGAWGNYFLDIIDGDVLLLLGMDDYSYQLIDKASDLVSYVFMLILGLRWRIKGVIVILFAYRVCGQILFFITKNELVFFYFQNFLEPLVLIYTLLIFIRKREEAAFATYKKHFFLIWGIILAYKIWNEWYLHFANIDLSRLIFGFSG